MKHKAIPALAALWLSASGQAADIYKIDPVHTSVTFSVRHMVISNVKGKFTEFAGSIVLEANTIKEANGTIQTKSIGKQAQFSHNVRSEPRILQNECPGTHTTKESA